MGEKNEMLLADLPAKRMRRQRLNNLFRCAPSGHESGGGVSEEITACRGNYGFVNSADFSVQLGHA